FFEIADTFLMASPAHFCVSLCPCAKPIKTCESGPTCMGLPSNRGDFTQVYFPSSWKPVYFGLVSPFHGCRVFSPSYQACDTFSVTPFRSRSSAWVLIA